MSVATARKGSRRSSKSGVGIVWSVKALRKKPSFCPVTSPLGSWNLQWLNPTSNRWK